MRAPRVVGAFVVASWLACCSTFGTGDGPFTGGDAAADAPTDDGAKPDAVADAAKPRTQVACGNRSCAVGEVCCVSGGVTLCRADCSAVDGGPGKGVFTFECGRSSDCPAGDVCCFEHATTSCSNFFGASKCARPENCRTCAEDGGLSAIGCDPQRSDECAGGTCSGGVPLDGVASPFWSRCEP